LLGQQQQDADRMQGLEDDSQQQLAPAQSIWLRRLMPKNTFEGVVGRPPSCKPQPSTVRKAKQLLSQGKGLAALLQLCPASSCPLLTYAAQARNMVLLKQLLAFKVDWLEPQVFPQNYTEHGGFFALIPTVLTAAAAAVQQRWPQVLAMLLAAKEGVVSYIAGPLLRLAVAHSDAACLELLITYSAAISSTRVAPEHLAVAAGRTDADAAGVVALLLQDLQHKHQLAAKWLMPAYAAACRNSSTGMLQQLLQAAAEAAAEAAAAEREPRWQQWHQRQHVLAALSACAGAGNAAVWQQLLQWFSAAADAADHEDTAMEDVSNSASSGDSSAMQQQQQLPGLHLSRLAAQDWLSILHAVLPQPVAAVSQPGVQITMTPAAALQAHQEETKRCSMADLLWCCLQDNFPASEAAVRQLLQASCSWQLLGEGTSSDFFLQRGVKKIAEADWVMGRQAAQTAARQTQAATAAQQRMSAIAEATMRHFRQDDADARADEDIASLEAMLQGIQDEGDATPPDTVLHAIKALAQHVHAERLLWLQQRGLLYGQSTQELLLHGLLDQAGRATAHEQHRLAMQYVKQLQNFITGSTGSCQAGLAAAGPAAAAAASPLVKDPRPDLANRVASLVFHGRVAAACKSGSIKQLQQLEQLQNLVSLLTRPEGLFPPFETLQAFCLLPASPAVAGAKGGSTAAATAAGLRAAGPAAAAAAAAGHDGQAWAATAAAAAASSTAAANRSANNIHNRVYALQLADQLGVPVLASDPKTPAESVQQDVLRQAAMQASCQQQGNLQAGNGPAPLWQLALFKMFELYPDSSICITAGVMPALSAVSSITSAVQECIQFQDLPDARVQMLTTALAGTKHAAVGGYRDATSPATRTEVLTYQRRMLGGLIAESAVEQLRPGLLQWVVQQQGLGEFNVSAEEAHRCNIPFMVDPGPVLRPITQSEQLQQASMFTCCPLAVGLQKTATAAGVCSAADAAAGISCKEGPEGELAAVVKTAMQLLQLQPTLQPTILSSWISDHLSAGRTSSSSSSASTGAARIARATAVLAAVAAAVELPAGAQAMQKVFVAGDADLLTQVVLWSSRLEAWDAEEGGAMEEEEQ
jgi:hypothetical protein